MVLVGDDWYSCGESDGAVVLTGGVVVMTCGVVVMIVIGAY